MRSLASAMREFRPRSREGGVRVARVRRSPRPRPAGRSARDFGSSRQRRCNPYKYLRNSGEFFSGLPFGGGRRSVAAVIDPPPGGALVAGSKPSAATVDLTGVHVLIVEDDE